MIYQVFNCSIVYVLAKLVTLLGPYKGIFLNLKFTYIIINHKYTIYVDDNTMSTRYISFMNYD